MAGQQVVVSVLADTKKFSRAMKNLGNETGMSKFASGLKNASKVIAGGLAVAGAGTLALSKKAVDAASNLEQSMGAVDAVFKNNAKQIHDWANGAATSLGLSKNQYNEFATVVGSQLKNMGIAQDQVTGKTNDLIKKGADLSAQFGGSTSDAVSALSALMRGEADPIERYGVSIKDADIKAQMLADGTNKLTGEQGKLARTQAILTLLNKQTADSQGAFARESNTLAGQQQRLKAKFENITATLGKKFLPAVTKVVEWVANKLDPAMAKLGELYRAKIVPIIKKVTDWFEDNREEIQALLKKVQEFTTGALKKLFETLSVLGTKLKDVAGFISRNRDVLMALAVAIGSGIALQQAYIKVMAIWKAATTAVTVATKLLNAAMKANVIGIVVTAVAALAAGLTYFFTQTETGRKIWSKFTAALSEAWAKTQAALSTGLKKLGELFNGFWNIVKKVWSYTPIGLITQNWNKILDFFKSIPGKIRGFFDRAIEWLKPSGNNILAGMKKGLDDKYLSVKTWFQNLPSNIKGFLAGAALWLVSGGKNIIGGLGSGIANRWGDVREFFSGLGDNIKRTIGNLGRLLWNAGKQIIQGLWDGLKNKWEDVKGWFGGIGTWIKDHKGPKAYDLALLVPAGKWIMTGLQEGLKSQIPALERTLSGVSATISGMNVTTSSQGLTKRSNTPLSTGQQGRQEPVIAQVDPKTLMNAFSGMSLSLVVDGQPMKAIMQSEVKAMISTAARGY